MDKEIQKYKILIAEDELFSAQYLKNLLVKADYDVVDIVTKGEMVIEKAQELEPDLILMDIMLADGISGTEAALSIKQNNPNIGIIFITAYAEDEMIEYASESNTYGYLIKPYKEMEILANIKIALSKMKHINLNSTTNYDTIQIDSNLLYDFKAKKLFYNEKEVILGLQAQLIVELLSKNINSSVSTQQICRYVWKDDVNNITLRTTINRIRNLTNKDFISTIRGYGYMISSRYTA